MTKILIVDDEAMMRMVAKRILSDSRNQPHIRTLPHRMRSKVERRAADLFFLIKNIPEDFPKNS